MKTKIRLIILLVFILLPFSSRAASLPEITSVDREVLRVEGENENYFYTFVCLYGANLDYIYDHADQTGPAVIQLGPYQPKSIRESSGSSICLFFKIDKSTYNDHQNEYIKTYKANGDLIQKFDQELLIYNENYIIPEITKVDDFVGVTSKKTRYEKTLTIEGQGLDYLVNNPSQVKFGKVRGKSASGNNESVDITFKIKSSDFTKGDKKRVRVFRDGKKIARSPEITLYNPYNWKYKDRKLDNFFENNSGTSMTKRRIGLNSNRALAADTDEKDEIFLDALNDSDTKWVREHISYDDFMGSDWRNWRERYDKVFRQHKKKNRRVVAMLAYGEDGSNKTPSEQDWEKFIKRLTVRYKNHIDAYEIWNEPDLVEYHDPNTVDDILPLMRVSYPIIKDRAPDSTVLNGPIGNIRVTDFVSELYSKAGNYFDELAIHVYYCDEYRRDGNTNAIISDFNDIINSRPADKRGDKIWVTELGCSMENSGITETLQKNYIKDASQALLNTGMVRNVLIYSLMNRSDQDAYENNFGLLYEDGTEKEAWDWYKSLPTK